jgi:hypothetical protein
VRYLSHTVIRAILVLAGTGAVLLGVRALVGGGRATHLREFENTVYSQAGDDGILERIFEIIPPTRHFAIEFGAGNGVKFSNVRRLFINRGWGGLLIEGDDELASQCRRSYDGIANVRTVQAWVFPANVELLFAENNVPRDLDLLVVDIDSNDWYVWRAIQEFRPKVVMIEYNGMFAPPQKMVIGFHPLTYWNEKNLHFGASIQSFYELGKQKGYELVGTDYRGINLFFVDRQYYPRFRLQDNSPGTMFRPYNFTGVYNPEDLRKGTQPEPPPELVMSEVRIQKRFRFDR